VEERSSSGSCDSRNASMSACGETNSCAVVMHDTDRRNDSKNADRASAFVLPGKRDQQNEVQHVRVVQVQLSRVVAREELINVHAEHAASLTIDEVATLGAIQLHHTRFACDRRHAQLPASPAHSIWRI
jgi:hypothetical protein